MTKTTNYKNISWKQSDRKWYGCVTFNKIKYPCGSFEDEIEAVKAVDKKIIALGLDYRKLQIIKPVPREK